MRQVVAGEHVIAEPTSPNGSTTPPPPPLLDSSAPPSAFGSRSLPAISQLISVLKLWMSQNGRSSASKRQPNSSCEQPGSVNSTLHSSQSAKSCSQYVQSGFRLFHAAVTHSS